MHARNVIITQCPDRLMWYRQSVGNVAPLLANLPAEDCYLSREGSGLTNIIRHADAHPMPTGYVPVPEQQLVQHRDLVLLHGTWVLSTPQMWGRPVADVAPRSFVIRPSAPLSF